MRRLWWARAGGYAAQVKGKAVLLLLLIGAGEIGPVPPVEDTGYHGDTYYYDDTADTGSINAGTVLPSETIYD